MRIACEDCGVERKVKDYRVGKTKRCKSCFYKSLLKPLLKEQVQEDWHRYINFKNQVQKIELRDYAKKGVFTKYHEWMVEVSCPECREKRRVGSRYLKEKSKKKNATLYCLRCKNRIKKGRWKNSDGYIWVNWRILPKEFQSMAKKMRFSNRNMILEHRVVMAVKIGRPLKSKELVRHINGNKTDNRPENLRLGSHSENSKDHASSFLENKILRGFVMDLGCDPDLIIKEKKKGIEIVKRKDTR
jgi:hypothetical protein